MKMCNAIKNQPQESLVAHVKRLVDRTMEGLEMHGSFTLDHKKIKCVCKAVMKSLKKIVCSKQMIELMILIQDPAVDAAIVTAVRRHVAELPDRQAKAAETASAARMMVNALIQSVFVIVGLVIITSLL